MERVLEPANPSQRLQYCRAVESAMWGMPLVSFYAMRQAFFRDAKADYGDIVYLSQPSDWKFQVTTPNTSSLYVLFHFNTSDGPIVFDIPAMNGTGLFGTLNDAWQVPIVEVGQEGSDEGEGAKYLVISPNEQVPLPEGYIPVRCETFNGYGALRVISKTMETIDLLKAVDLIKQIRIYPLSKEDNPPVPRFIDMQGKLFDGIVRMDESFYEQLARMINEERIQEKDLIMTSYLRSLGIEKGKVFKPDYSSRELLRSAIQEVHHILMSALLIGTPYWPDSSWLTPGLGNAVKTQFSFVEPTFYDIDSRATTFFTACAPPLKLGKASVYLVGTMDSKKEVFRGDESYHLRVPAKVPAKQFWAVNIYDLETAAFPTSSPKISLDSYDEKVEKNSDGSVDVYFGPTAPEGKESNWIKTEPGKSWFLFFRLYGPERAIFDRTWVLPDIERVAVASRSSSLKYERHVPGRDEPMTWYT